MRPREMAQVPIHVPFLPLLSSTFHVRTLYMLLALSTIGCAPPDPSGVLVIGHGGLGPSGQFPMDSREAILSALDLGMDGVEMDAQLTSNGDLVAFHDLEVTTGDRAGPIHAFTLHELNDCMGGSQPIGRLDKILLEAIQRHPEAEFTLDVKLNTKGDWWSYLHAFTEAIIRLDSLPPLHGRILVECRTSDFLRLMHAQAPTIPVYLYADDADLAISEAVELGCAGVTLHTDHADEEQVAAARAKGLSITLFGITGDRTLRRAVA